MLQHSTVSFLSDLASDKPAPGGGGAAALTGALGVSLGLMVINLTKGKKKYLHFEADHLRLLEDLETSLKKLSDLVQADADNFIPLSKAYGLPQGTEEEKAHKVKVMEDCLGIATKAPVGIMEESVLAMSYLDELMEKGSKLVLSDVGVGVALLNGAVQGASLNVFINAKMMKNREVAEKLVSHTEELMVKADEFYQRIFNQVKKEISS